MLLFHSLLLGSNILLATPDTARTTAPQQLFKLGVNGFETETILLTYERQLAERWSVLGGMGYFGYSFRGHIMFFDDNGTPVNTAFVRQTRNYSANVQLRHYFRSRRPRPLTGWFAAGNLQFVRQTSRSRYTNYFQHDYSSSSHSVQLQALLGRQWLLGRRLTLDSYLGMSLRRRQSVLVEGGVVLQVGYRFQPLPRN